MDIENLISRYLDGELSTEQEGEFHHMLAVSPEARDLFREHLKLQTLAKNDQVLQRPSPSMHAALFARLASEEGMEPAAVPAFANLAELETSDLSSDEFDDVSDSFSMNNGAIPKESLPVSGQNGRMRSMQPEPSRGPVPAANTPQEEEERRRRRLIPILIPFMTLLICAGSLWYTGVLGELFNGSQNEGEIVAYDEIPAGDLPAEGLPSARSSQTLTDADRTEGEADGQESAGGRGVESLSEGEGVTSEEMSSSSQIATSSNSVAAISASEAEGRAANREEAVRPSVQSWTNSDDVTRSTQVSPQFLARRRSSNPPPTPQRAVDQQSESTPTTRNQSVAQLQTSQQSLSVEENGGFGIRSGRSMDANAERAAAQDYRTLTLNGNVNGESEQYALDSEDENALADRELFGGDGGYDLNSFSNDAEDIGLSMSAPSGTASAPAIPFPSGITNTGTRYDNASASGSLAVAVPDSPLLGGAISVHDQDGNPMIVTRENMDEIADQVQQSFGINLNPESNALHRQTFVPVPNLVVSRDSISTTAQTDGLVMTDPYKQDMSRAGNIAPTRKEMNVSDAEQAKSLNMNETDGESAAKKEKEIEIVASVIPHYPRSKYFVGVNSSLGGSLSSRSYQESHPDQSLQGFDTRFTSSSSAPFVPDFTAVAGMEIGPRKNHRIFATVGISPFTQQESVHRVSTTRSSVNVTENLTAVDASGGTIQLGTITRAQVRSSTSDLVETVRKSMYEMVAGAGYRFSIEPIGKFRLGGEAWVGIGTEHLHTRLALPVSYAVGERMRLEFGPEVRYRRSYGTAEMLSTGSIDPTATQSSLEERTTYPTNGEELRIGAGIGLILLID